MSAMVPEGWKIVKLGDIAQWGSGGTPSRTEPDYYGGDIPWLKTGDLNNNIITEVEECITELGLKNSSAKLCPPGTVCIAMYGATIGKTGILGISAATNQACATAQVNEGIDNRFLHYYLKSQKQEFIEKGKGGAQPNISQAVIKNHPFPFLPLAEQQRLVTKLDALFGSLEQLKIRLNTIPQLLKTFRQAVLTQAVTGKLTREWREGKGVEEWEEYSLNEITKLDVGQAFKSSEFEREGIRLLRGQNIEPGSLRWIDTVFFPIDKLEKFSHLYIKQGDVILAMDRPIISTGLKVAKAKEEDLPCVLVQRVARFKPSENLLSEFLYLIVSSDSYIIHLNGEQAGSQIPHISANQILSYSATIPPLSEQHEIVRRVEGLLSKADAIEARYRSLKGQVDALPQAVLGKAFRGALL